MSSNGHQAERPTYGPVQLKDGSGHFVRITWSDGVERQINGFTDEAEARAWIAANESHWHEWELHRVQPKR
jgi:hypothetical protein